MGWSGGRADPEEKATNNILLEEVQSLPVPPDAPRVLPPKITLAFLPAMALWQHPACTIAVRMVQLSHAGGEEGKTEQRWSEPGCRAGRWRLCPLGCNSSYLVLDVWCVMKYLVRAIYFYCALMERRVSMPFFCNRPQYATQIIKRNSSVPWIQCCWRAVLTSCLERLFFPARSRLLPPVTRYTPLLWKEPSHLYPLCRSARIGLSRFDRQC